MKHLIIISLSTIAGLLISYFFIFKDIKKSFNNANKPK